MRILVAVLIVGAATIYFSPTFDRGARRVHAPIGVADG